MLHALPESGTPTLYGGGDVSPSPAGRAFCSARPYGGGVMPSSPAGRRLSGGSLSGTTECGALSECMTQNRARNQQLIELRSCGLSDREYGLRDPRERSMWFRGAAGAVWFGLVRRRSGPLCRGLSRIISNHIVVMIMLEVHCARCVRLCLCERRVLFSGGQNGGGSGGACSMCMRQ